VKDKILATLEQIEKAEGVVHSRPAGWGAKTKYASVPRGTGMFLHDLVLKHKPKTIFEIGGSVGYSTLWLALAAEQIQAHVYTTEINSLRIKLAREHYKMAAAEETITLFEQDAREVLKQVAAQQKQIDFVFLDAFKKDYPEFIESIATLLTNRGIIVMDNVSTHENLLKNFLERITKDSRFLAQKIDQDNGILILSKIT